MNRRIRIRTYGGVRGRESTTPSYSITDYVVEAINTYSKNDIALFFGQKYLDRQLDATLLEQITEDHPYDSEKNVQGKVYKIRVMNSKTEYKHYGAGEMPEILTLEQRLSMGWLENLAHAHGLDNMPRTTYLFCKKINDFIYSIADHGFTEDSYKHALKKNINDLRDRYKIYDFKRNRSCI